MYICMCVYIYAYTNGNWKLLIFQKWNMKLNTYTLFAKHWLESLCLSICFSQVAVLGLGLTEFNHVICILFLEQMIPKMTKIFEGSLTKRRKYIDLGVLVMLVVSIVIWGNKRASNS